MTARDDYPLLARLLAVHPRWEPFDHELTEALDEIDRMRALDPHECWDDGETTCGCPPVSFGGVA